MDEVFVIRHRVRVEKQSIRRVAREMGISRNTVRRYLKGETVIGQRQAAARPRPTLDRVRQRMEEVLADAPRFTGGKQRLTATRLHRMLLEEGHQVGETLVKDFVREWRRQRREVFVPLVYHPGDLGEVDFFEVLVEIAGQRRKAWMFVVRLMYSGRDFAWLYDRQDQVCFLDGHVRAFAHFGFVPTRLVYDNLRLAVARMLVGSQRVLTERFLALATHYAFEACFARPATGHDKGGVEARGKSIRWQHLVPIPSGPDLAAISTELLARLDAHTRESCDAQGQRIVDRFVEEQARALPLPAQAFRPAAVRLVVASRRALVKIEGAAYSVPCRWAGLSLTAHVGADDVVIVGPEDTVTHPRLRCGERSVDYRHYLRELARKPQAVRQVASELVRDLGEPFASAWRKLVDDHGPKEGARAFARVLKGIEDLGEREVAERLRRALECGEPILLALRPPSPPPVAVAIEDLPACLRDVEVATASLAEFDLLLGGVQ